MTQTRDSIADIWGPRTPYEGEDAWPQRIDMRVQAEPERWVQSACVLCSHGCGLDIGVRDGTIVGVRGRGDDAVNRGRLGPKGLHGWEANPHTDRLTRPLIRRKGRFEAASWDRAMDLIVRKSRELMSQATGSSIGFYTSGQLMLEEYYTLSVIGKAGIGTPHMDANTRLCTATAASALKETFGSDGQPACFFDIDVTDCLLLVGHNVAATDTVLWSRILDRLSGSRPPSLIVIDPRRTATAEKADLHLAPRLGTNVALLNGILHLLIQNPSAIATDFVERCTVGFSELAETVMRYPPEVVERITGVAAADLRRAAAMIGEAPTLLSTCLQGVYQSMQATAAAVQVNNINLVRGMIGRPGCGILQMNGQPTAQNNRECGADGDLPAFRNWDNPNHVQELARIWNVEPAIIPHWAPPTHALEIFHLAEMGSIRMLWIAGTNPAVSMPHLHRVRQVLRREDVFVVVQDAFFTETAGFADVVLPASIWGEKTGTFTNADRTVHISHKAVEPPGEARSDFDIWRDYAPRMEFKDKDGAPLIKWSTPEEAFEAWKICSRGRPCDYTGLSYDRLSQTSGIQWPCPEGSVSGARRLYTDGAFPTHHEVCENFGHDLITGADITPQQYRSNDPAGKAILKPAEYQAALEQPDDDYPFMLTTGRVVYHFHTRTKTGRARELAAAAPEAFAQISDSDATRLCVGPDDWVRISSRRGSVDLPVRIEGMAIGEIFTPFHYGYWDNPGHSRAANELTLYGWDAVSKQPHFKYAAVKLEKIAKPAAAEPRNARGTAQGPLGSAVTHAETLVEEAAAFAKRRGPARSHVRDYLGMLRESEARLEKALAQVKANHLQAPDIEMECGLFASWAAAAGEELEKFSQQYGEKKPREPKRIARALIRSRPNTGVALVRDLHDLWLLANESLISLTVLKQAAQALRDEALETTLIEIEARNRRQLNWLMSRIRQAGPQALVVPS